MKKKLRHTALVIISVLLLLSGISLAFLYGAVKSGWLRSYIERKAEDATGLRVNIGTLQLGWSFSVEARQFSAALPGEEQHPILTADRLQVKTSLGALLRRQFVLVEVGSPRISLNKREWKFLEEKFASPKSESGGFSVAMIHIKNGAGTLDVPPIKADLEGINSTFGTSIVSNKKKVLTLNASQVHIQLERENQTPYDILFKDYKSDISFVPLQAATTVQVDASALATAALPLLAPPPDIPVNVSMTTDYLPQEDALQNVDINIQLPFLKDAHAYGSLADLAGIPSPNLAFAAEFPRMRELVEYIGALKRPQYEHLKLDGSLGLTGEIHGTIHEPNISVDVKAANGEIDWNGLLMEGIQAEIPATFEAGAFTAGPGVVSADGGSIPVADQVLAVSDVTARVSANSSALHIDDLEAATASFGKIAARASYEFASGGFRADASLHDASSRSALKFLSSALPDFPGTLSLSGRYSIDCGAEGTFDGELREVKTHFRYSLRDADFSPVESSRLSGLNVELQGSASTEAPKRTWKFGVTGDVGNFAVKTASFEKALPAGRYPLSVSGEYDITDGALRNVAASVDLAQLGNVKASGYIGLASGEVNLAVAGEHIYMQQLSESISPAIFALPKEVSLAGTAGIAGTLKGKLLPKPQHLEGSISLRLRDGEFASGEFITVAGLAAQVQGSFETDSPAHSWMFDANGNVGGFELLVQTYYNSFQNSTFPFSLSGTYGIDTHELQGMKASVGLADMGGLSATGTATVSAQPAFDVQVKSEKLDLGRLYDQVGRQVLTTALSPVFKKANVTGFATGDIAVHSDATSWQTKGRLEIADGSFALKDEDLAIGSMALKLPFELHSPGDEGSSEEAGFNEKDFGTIQLGSLTLGPAHIAALDLAVALKENALYVKKPDQVEVLGGTLDLGEVRAKNLLSPSAELKSAFSVEGIQLAPLSRAMGLPELPGTINALFPSLVCSRSDITTTGMAQIYAFDGTVAIDSVGVEQPFSPVRTFMANLNFDNIRLGPLTDALNFGRITGVLDGTVAGLEVSQGQPAAFVADFETVKERGVSQVINFDAVDNISILGTGRGIPATIGRGLFSFIDEFRYDKIGFHTTLKNDNFNIRGKVVRDNTEYFVKGVFLGPSINVINRNPGQTVSFKSMLERLSRVGRSETEKTK